jgi:FKBP-type peptidyl-prolyl cis-trans isomerase
MKKLLYIGLAALALIALPSCLSDDDTEVDQEWLQSNTEYYSQMETLTDNGKTVYTKVMPSWISNSSILMRWYNDRSLTQSALVPMDNSTCYIKYECRLIDGTVIDNSYSTTTYGDSLYRTKPLSNITGMWVALTNMHVGDSVTAVVPSNMAYGSTGYSSVPANSTLIFDIKLVDVPAYETPL